VSGHDDVRSLAELVREVVDQVPEKSRPGSLRRREGEELRGARGGGGVTRAQLLDELNVDLQVMVGYLALLVDGVADLLEIASTRANKVNGPALANVVRPTVECAGSVRWLLDEEITAEVRVRRYLIWRFDDLRQQRRLLSGLRHVDPSKLHAAHSELASSERDLLAKVESAGWRARPSQSTGAQYKSAALLTDTGTAESMPPFTKLVDDLPIPKGMYQLLSVTTHNHR